MARRRNRKGKRRKQLLDTAGFSVENPAKKGNPTLLEACGGDEDKLFALMRGLKKAEGLQTLRTGEIQKFKMSDERYKQVFGV